jgi:hypothetical protein
MDQQWGTGTEAMTQFAGLLSKDMSAAPAQHYPDLSRRLTEALKNSGLGIWKRGDPIVVSGRRLLIGIAPYSIYDLRLLDAINDRTASGEISDRIDVFDILNCEKMTDLDSYVPGIGIAYQTPVVGIWIDGILKQKCSGHQARQLLISMYTLSGLT